MSYLTTCIAAWYGLWSLSHSRKESRYSDVGLSKSGSEYWKKKRWTITLLSMHSTCVIRKFTNVELKMLRTRASKVIKVLFWYVWALHKNERAGEPKLLRTSKAKIKFFGAKVSSYQSSFFVTCELCTRTTERAKPESFARHQVVLRSHNQNETQKYHR